jgi:hypothetical protein
MQYFRRIPKRGFSNADFRTVYHIVNIAALVNRFKKGATVDATALVEAGLIRNFKNPVKVLGQGDIDISLHVTADKFSESAVKKIEAAGGSVSVIVKKKWKRVWPAKTKTKVTAEVTNEATEEVVEKVTEEVVETQPVDSVETETDADAEEE